MTDKKRIPAQKQKTSVEEVDVNLTLEWDENYDSLTIHLNKELVPILLIITTPLLSFIMGFGLRSTFAGIALYYFIPLLLAVLRNRMKGEHIKGKLLFFLLLTINIIISVMFYLFNYLSLNAGKFFLVVSYLLIILYLLLMAGSFWTNNPYFAEYYRTINNGYKTVYRVIGVFFIFLVVIQIPMYIKVIMILKTLNIP